MKYNKNTSMEQKNMKTEKKLNKPWNNLNNRKQKYTK